jgi:hypothetical protein
MKPYDWIAAIFGISGWAFSFFLWRKYRRSGNKKPAIPKHSVQPPVAVRSSQTGKATTAPAPIVAPMPRASVREPKIHNTPEDKLHIEATDEKRRLVISGKSKPVLIVLAILVIAGLVYSLISRRDDKAGSTSPSGSNLITTGDVSFIKLTSSINFLQEQPEWKTATIKTGESGSGIEVVLGVLWDPYRWVKADSQRVAIDTEERVTFAIEDVIRAFQDDEKRPIVVIGLASHENADEHPDEEIARASDRADKLVDVCSKHFVNNRPHIYSVNLGAFRPGRNPSIYSASERRVALMVIVNGEGTPNLTAEIKKALIKAKEEQKFIFDARDYSLFDTDRFQVNPRANF